MDSKYIKVQKQLAMGKHPTVTKTAKATPVKSNTNTSGKKMYGMGGNKGNAVC